MLSISAVIFHIFKYVLGQFMPLSESESGEMQQPVRLWFMPDHRAAPH